MEAKPAPKSDDRTASAAPSSVSAPSISVPKGGGAIRGIGEKFAANPVTGTASMSVPIYASTGRSGFGPQLSLSYDSGSGNGPFGFGWDLALPAIARKTQKGLPTYRDADEADVFVLSGAEDLVPVLVEQDGDWVREVLPDRVIDGESFQVQRYRPRIEGLFARIERCRHRGTGEVHWRCVSKDNVLTLYGKDADSRICDPSDPARIFSWLICETRDDKGNAVVYRYKAEDGAGVDPGRVNECNRGAVDDPRRATNRYLKRICYGNRIALLDEAGRRPPFLDDVQAAAADWMFELVFDYGEHEPSAPMPNDVGPWDYRIDPFSTYRPGFEVRTTRLCRRVLMFHHFPDEAGVGSNCLVRSTDFTYSHQQDAADARNPIYTFLRAVTQSGYRRRENGYDKRSVPAVELEYTLPIVQDAILDVDAKSLENLPVGADDASYQWTDLHGEGIPGVLSEQAGAWFYKRNLSAIAGGAVELAAMERVATKPNLTRHAARAQFMDLAGDGQPDLVVLDGPVPGLYEHDDAESWQPFRPFTSRLDRNLRDPNLRFVDLDGDGHADVLVAEGDTFVWHASRAEAGFGPARRVHQALDEEKGPRVIFSDDTQSIHLADMCGDGLADIVRIRNGEVCYWPNLGYGRFGNKVTMDRSPHFDNPDQFDQRRIRLADIDGSGTSDIIYLHRDGVRLYFNQSGNGWSAPQKLHAFPCSDDVAAVATTDLLGNGTACLVWSSPLPRDARRQMRYVNLMGAEKPHLLSRTVNNLGAETRIRYAPSTKFYLQDQRDGKPWITRLPFPVHLVERVETYDHISRNRFVTRYAYHHGYFDGEEREFRGFGMVEQWDTEEVAVLGGGGAFPDGDNFDAASHVPPAHTKTWFHTGVYLGRDRVSDFFAGLSVTDSGEYFREPGLTDAQARSLLLPDTILPPGLTAMEAHEACRALKGAMLRQEVYALDGSTSEAYPYTVAEQNFDIRVLQPRAGNRHAVFFTHAREAANFHYERNPADPRIQHALTLEVDAYGNVLRQAVVGYGRRQADAALPTDADRDKQARTLITCTENRVTNAIDLADAYRVPLPCESRTYELTGLALPPGGNRFTIPQLIDAGATASVIEYHIDPTEGQLQKRVIEHVRSYYRRDDLTGRLALGELQLLALPFESYQLAFTPGLLVQAYEDRVAQSMLLDGRYVHTEGDAHWWISSGQRFFSPGEGDAPAQELAFARQHFFMPHRFVDPFGNSARVRYDAHDLLTLESEDALQNKVTAGERDALGNIVHRNDYRVLAPTLVTDPNGNRSAVVFDTLGMPAGTAVMGKSGDVVGDSLSGLEPDIDEAALLADIQDPLAAPHAMLQQATTRLVYDLFAYQRTRDEPQPQPASVHSLSRETHHADLAPGAQTAIQHTLAYFDGFGREIQKKIQAEPGPLITDGAQMNPRWAGGGWTLFNNKGKPVRKYEPFFSATHRFEFANVVGVSSTLFYDPVGRVVATLYPNHTYDKVVFNPWRQETWDVNDTTGQPDPKNDPDVGGFFRKLAEVEYLPTWHASRESGQLGGAQQDAALKAAAHANTPSVAHLDTLERVFLTLADNGAAEKYATRVELDIEGNPRAIVDAKARVVMRYDYDMLGKRIRQASMEAGMRWLLNDAAGKPIYRWDNRGHIARTTYDQLQRPADMFVRAGNGPERLVERLVYGETSGAALNHRGRIFRHFDSAGLVTYGAYDFKANLLRSTRRFAVDYQDTLDWSIDPPLQSADFVSETTFDALNRPVVLKAPDNSLIRPTYNEAGLLERVEVNLRGASAATVFVSDIDYDAKAQRELIVYGSGVRSLYEYDPLTFRLARLQTLRGAEHLQDLRYTYDPVGNITAIRDDAQQTIYFNNQVVEPHAGYTYDAIYRLIAAAGREHIGQQAQPQTNWNDDARIHLPHPHDGQAMRRYAEQYEYDEVGSFLNLIHQASNGNWTRTYSYDEPSLVQPAVTNNRLSSVSVAGITEAFTHDAHGNMSQMPHLAQMSWDYKDQLKTIDLGGGGTAYYVYDASGQRVRKIIERQNGTRRKERLYLGGFEFYREYDGSGEAVSLERETLHITDGARRIALVETLTANAAAAITDSESLTRYQLGNHLGSASLELDDAGQIISYEEYYAYGSTSYQAGRSAAEVSLKRYRYTDKERDEESGLCYHGARYYAPWLGRWTSCDPSGLTDGPNLYVYCRCNPMVMVDADGRECSVKIPNCKVIGKELLYTSTDPWVFNEDARVDRVENWGGGVFAGYRLTWGSKSEAEIKASEAKPKPQPKPKPKAEEPKEKLILMRPVMINSPPSESPTGRLIHDLVKGDTAESKSGWWGVVGQVIVGFTPGVGQVADARDTLAAASKVTANPLALAAWGGLLVAAIAWVPGGDVLKSGKKVAAKMTKDQFKNMVNGVDVFVYRIVDEQGNVLKYGTSIDPTHRIYGYKSEGGAFSHMEVVGGPYSRAQALGLESKLIDDGFELDIPTLNDRTNTLAEMKGGADFRDVVETPKIDLNEAPIVRLENPYLK